MNSAYMSVFQFTENNSSLFLLEERINQHVQGHSACSRSCSLRSPGLELPERPFRVHRQFLACLNCLLLHVSPHLGILVQVAQKRVLLRRHWVRAVLEGQKLQE